MGTRGFVSYKNEDGVLEYIYCGHDAYPSHLGGILLNTYNTDDRIKKLLALGDMSSIDTVLDKCETYADGFDNEENTAKVVMTEEDLADVAKYIDYTYLFRDGKWFISRWDYADRMELTQQMIDEDC